MLLPIAQIFLAVTIIVLILLQERSSGLSGLFGGDSGGVYQTRRGAEKAIFIATIVATGVFIALAILQLTLLR